MITVEQIVDFIEMNTSTYAWCDYLTESIISYAEMAVRKKYEDDDHDEEAGLLMAAAINYAFLHSLVDRDQSFISLIEKEDIAQMYTDIESIESLIIYYATKVAEAEFEHSPYEERDAYLDSLDYTVRFYIHVKDSKEDEEQR